MNQAKRRYRRFTPEEKIQHVEKCRREGLSAKEYCVHNDLCYSSFLRWRIGQNAATDTQVTVRKRFCPVDLDRRPSEQRTAEPCRHIILQVNQKYSLLLEENFSSSFLLQILHTLEEL